MDYGRFPKSKLREIKKGHSRKNKRMGRPTIQCVPRFKEGKRWNWTKFSDWQIHKFMHIIHFSFLWYWHCIGDTVYLQKNSDKSARVRKIKWEKRGSYIRYKVPKYRVEFPDLKRSPRWVQEYELKSIAKTVVDAKKN